jgi:hypothetical protein
MSLRNIAVSAWVIAIFAVTGVRPALAQFVLDSRTEFTFKEPVELPGVMLPAGTYVFRFADAATSRTVLEVLSRDRPRKMYGIFVTLSVQRPRPADHAEVRFMETPVGAAHAIRTWWYPGNSIGREFIYSKTQARRLAALTRSRVLTTKGERVSAEEMQKATLAYVSPSGEESTATDDHRSGVDTFASGQAPGADLTSALAIIGSRVSLMPSDAILPIVAVIGMSSLAARALARFRR